MKFWQNGNVQTDLPAFGLDFETFSEADITKVGLDNYLNHPSTRPLMASMYTRPQSMGTMTMYAGHQKVVTSYAKRTTFDFVHDPTAAAKFKEAITQQKGFLVAHNAAFEIGVLRLMKIFYPLYRVVDTAVIASEFGGGRSLANASSQLTHVSKLDTGVELIKLFSLPNKHFDFKAPTKEIIQASKELQDKWELFKEYCEQDACASWELASTPSMLLPAPDVEEHKYFHITRRMNELGWKVDIDSVQLMQDRYEQNLEKIHEDFKAKHDPAGELNLNSLKQLTEWCAARGIKANSFNELSVQKLIKAIERRLAKTEDHTTDKAQGWIAVLEMLRTKQELGGSSLKKLEVLLNQTNAKDHRLRDQYLHLGASQTYRTSGRGVQMQNLKRLRNAKDMATLADPSVEWSNEELAENLRQVFTATNPNPDRGALVVGDFSSVESRGLAWMAGATWKLEDYRQGKDLYKVLATKMYHISYDQVTHEQRTAGKVGELSCGYGAGPGAVQSFAEGMGIDLSEDEAKSIVYGWRGTNQEIVSFWNLLDKALHSAVRGAQEMVDVHRGEFYFLFETVLAPTSLREQHPGAASLQISLNNSTTGEVLFTRVFHGVHENGKGNVCYYKPSARKTGPSWLKQYTDPKTKQQRTYDLYGGKLAGILTQSLCRELFFSALSQAQDIFEDEPGVNLVGQFHDEIVVDVDLDECISVTGLDEVCDDLSKAMSNPSIKGSALYGFPLNAEVFYDWRYTK